MEWSGQALLLLQQATSASFRFECLSDLNWGFFQVCGRCILDVLDADAIDSVTLVGFGVLLTIEHVPKMRAAAVADDLDTSHIQLDANVAQVTRIIAFVKGIPTTVLELGHAGVERKFACTACKVCGGGRKTWSAERQGRWVPKERPTQDRATGCTQPSCGKNL